MPKRSKNWAVFAVGEDQHVVPRNDLITHKRSRSCPCRPTFVLVDGQALSVPPDDGPCIVCHTAVDNREK